MNIFIIKTIKIRSYEMGLYFRDGEFKGLLREGRHWFVRPAGQGQGRGRLAARRRGSRTRSST